MKKRISDAGFRRIAQGVGTLPTLQMNPGELADIDESTPTQPAGPAYELTDEERKQIDEQLGYYPQGDPQGAPTQVGFTPPAEAPQMSENAQELVNFLKGAFPSDYLFDEVVRRMDPAALEEILQTISDEHDVMPTAELDPEDFDFGF